MFLINTHLFIIYTFFTFYFIIIIIIIIYSIYLSGTVHINRQYCKYARINQEDNFICSPWSGVKYSVIRATTHVIEAI